jgi:hypothetical protein
MTILLEIFITLLFALFAIASFLTAEAERKERLKNRKKNP